MVTKPTNLFIDRVNIYARIYISFETALPDPYSDFTVKMSKHIPKDKISNAYDIFAGVLQSVCQVRLSYFKCTPLQI